MRYVQFRYSAAVAAAASGNEAPFCRYYSPTVVIAPCSFTIEPDETIMVLMLDTPDLVSKFMTCCQTVNSMATLQLCMVVWNRGDVPVRVDRHTVLADLLVLPDIKHNLVLTPIDDITDSDSDSEYQEINDDVPDRSLPPLPPPCEPMLLAREDPAKDNDDIAECPGFVAFSTPPPSPTSLTPVNQQKCLSRACGCSI